MGSRLAAPNHWMLDKLTGKYAPKPSQGPHKQRECLPLVVLLRNRLKFALTMKEVSIDKTGQHFRLLLDTKGRYAICPISAKDANFKLRHVKMVKVGKKGIP